MWLSIQKEMQQKSWKIKLNLTENKQKQKEEMESQEGRDEGSREQIKTINHQFKRSNIQL